MFSKLGRAFSIRSKDAENIVVCISKIIEEIGAPQAILTDNGLEFKNKYVLELAEQYGLRSNMDHHINLPHRAVLSVLIAQLLINLGK